MSKTEISYQPDEVLRLKDQVLAAFAQLPTEHQATLGLVLTQTVLAGAWGSWFQNALSVQAHAKPPALAIAPVSRSDVQALVRDPDDMALLSDDDLALITVRVQAHLADTVLREMLREATEQLLEEKQEGAAN